MLIKAAFAMFVAFVAAWTLTGALRRLSINTGKLDIPNERSSHISPTPTGGGLAIVAATYISSALLYCLDGLLWDKALYVFLIGGIAIAAVGYSDDRYGLSPWMRLPIHILCATLAVYILGVPPLPLLSFSPDWILAIATVLMITWHLNLYNFMDGLDGIVVTETITVVLAGALIILLVAPDHQTLTLFAMLLSAVAGFAIWNKPPAKIFMGDAASGFIGFCLAVLALWTVIDGVVGIATWLTLLGVFLVDSSLTLLRRIIRRERIYEAHCGHGYQCMAQLLQRAYRGQLSAEMGREKAHRTVSVVVTLVNLLWLMPIAICTVYFPEWGEILTAIAWAPLVIWIYETQNNMECLRVRDHKIAKERLAA